MPGRVTQHAVENKPSQLIDLGYIQINMVVYRFSQLAIMV